MDNKTIIYQIDHQNQEHNMVLSAKLEFLKKVILELPDNPNIKRLNSQCYVMSWSQLGISWSPVYYDFKAQGKMIAQELGKCEKENIVNRLLDILNEGKIVLKSGSTSYTEKLHPDFIQSVVTALGLKWQSNAVWPKGVISTIGDDDTTRDLHENRSAAVAVCNTLMKDGFGGGGKVFPLRISADIVLYPY